MLSKFPGLPLSFQEQALLQGAMDLGSSNPDDVYGFGRLDILASYQWLVDNYYPLLNIYYFPWISLSP